MKYLIFGLAYASVGLGLLQLQAKKSGYLEIVTDYSATAIILPFKWLRLGAWITVCFNLRMHIW